ncbi:hypothetical protein B0H11DRAFT_1930050 [Mycena galericulata]|nr:hypothetical protein B0H11DRAFT_1930050 [Mycena galericulata]
MPLKLSVKLQAGLSGNGIPRLISEPRELSCAALNVSVSPTHSTGPYAYILREDHAGKLANWGPKHLKKLVKIHPMAAVSDLETEPSSPQLHNTGAVWDAKVTNAPTPAKNATSEYNYCDGFQHEARSVGEKFKKGGGGTYPVGELSESENRVTKRRTKNLPLGAGGYKYHDSNVLCQNTAQEFELGVESICSMTGRMAGTSHNKHESFLGALMEE